MMFDKDVYMNVDLISPNCLSCKRMDIDTIGEEKYKLKQNPDGSTSSIHDGYENRLQCKYFDECKKIFEEGYTVTKVVEPTLIIESEKFKELMKTPKESSEKKPATKKTTVKKPAAKKETKKTTTKKVAAKK